MKKISLAAIKKAKIGHVELGTEVRDRLNEGDFFLPSMNLVAYAALVHFNFRDLENTVSSIEKHCKKVLSTFGFLEKEKPVELFFNLILNLRQAPIFEQQRLEEEVRNDLAVLDGILKHYKTLDFIKRLEKSSDSPRNQNEKMLKEFYKRTVKKREEIIEYLLYELNKKALENSKPRHKEIVTNDLFNSYKDFPYRTFYFSEKAVHGIDITRYDYRKIDLQGHKKTPWSKSTYTYGQEGYSSEFIEKVRHELKGESYLSDIKQEVKDLPFLRNRSEIIDELDELYKAGKWYGFYALAIPQVEGLFSQMLQVIEPDTIPKGVLPDKVQALRQYHESAEYFFDYYEFHLPELRNKFSHSGNEEDIELKSKLILLDLHKVIDVFGQLETPAIRLHNLLIEGPKKIRHLGDLIDFLMLVQEVGRTKHIVHYKEKIEEFVYKELTSEIDLAVFCEKLAVDFQTTMETFETMFIASWALVLNDDELVKLFEFTPKQFMKHINKIRQVFDEGYLTVFKEHLKFMLDLNYFCHKFPVLFPNLDKTVSEQIELVSSTYKKEFEICKLLETQLKPKIDFGYLILQNNLTHIIRN